MGTGNKHRSPFIIVLGTLIILISLSFVDTVFSWNGFTFKPMDVIAEIREAAPAKAKAPAKRKHPRKFKKDTVNIADSARLNQTDSTAQDEDIAPVNPFPSRDFTTYKGIINYFQPDYEQNGLQHFLDALLQLQHKKRGKVRIAYFGDSMIEGDLITMDLRDSLQTYFGGNGVGFVPITSVVSSFRTSIIHTYSSDWKDFHFKNDRPDTLLLGISGHSFEGEAGSWVKYRAVNRPHLNHFEKAQLLYSKIYGNASVTVNNGTPLKLSGNYAVNMLNIPMAPKQTSLNMVFDMEPGNELYGMCFEGDSGIVLDNFSFRGISGIELGKLQPAMLKSLQAKRPYDLIVLHYGANVLFKPELTDYDWFARPMKRVIASLHETFPDASFLIVGTADKSYKKDGFYVTAPGVQPLITVQNEIAQEHGFAFWSLFNSMGGNGSMTKWVEADTSLANKDYTHFNARGARKVAGLLYKAIMDEYKQAEKY